MINDILNIMNNIYIYIYNNDNIYIIIMNNNIYINFYAKFYRLWKFYI